MKTLIAIPCMNTIPTKFMLSIINLKHGKDDLFAVTEATLIHTARGILADQAVAAGCERIMWLDSDIRFQPDLMQRLHADLDEGRDFVSGLYFKRVFPVEPTIFATVYPYRKSDIMYDYPHDTIFEIAGCGFGACMMTTQMYIRVSNAHPHPFTPFGGLGEDLAFCHWAQQEGYKLYCDSRIKPGHIGMYEFMEDDYDKEAFAK